MTAQYVSVSAVNRIVAAEGVPSLLRIIMHKRHRKLNPSSLAVRLVFVAGMDTNHNTNFKLFTALFNN